MAVTLTAAITPVRHKSPFLFLLLSVMVSSTRGGFRAGLFATVLSLLAATRLLRLYPTMENVVPLALYCAVAVAVSWITDRLRQSQVALSTSNEQLRRDQAALAERNERLTLLAQASRHLLTTEDPRHMVRGLYDIIAGHLQLDAYFNFLVDESGRALRMESCAGIPDEEARRIDRLEFGQAVCGTVALLRTPIQATEIQSSDDPKVQLVRGYGIRVYACNPLFAGKRLLGTLSFASRRRDRFDQDEIEFMQTIAHHAELALERVQLTGALRQANQALQAVVENSPLPIWAVDREDRVQVWNPAAQHVFGWSREELLAQPLPVVPEDAIADYRHTCELVHRGQTLVGLETDRRTKAGRTLITSTSLSPLRDGAGEITGVLAIAADITEQKAMEQQLRETQRLESIGVLAGGIAHDFNNLLVGVIGGASLAVEMTEDAELKAVMESVANAGERAADLTRQLLAYAGKARFVTRKFTLPEVVSETMTLVQASIPKRVEIRLELDPQAPAVEGDRTQVQQLIMNLVLNAAEATEGCQHPLVQVKAGRVEPEDCEGLGFRADSAGSYASLMVTDNGCGMDQETRHRIFEPFFTTKFAGRGLGLAAVSGILRAHKGQIRVESTPGAGTRMTTLLPAAESAENEAAGSAPVAAECGGGTVLVVDDEAAVRNFARTCLKRYGYDVLMASNGQEALQVLAEQHHRIALMLLDLTMPLMGGGEVLEFVTERYPGLRVILSSGHAEAEARQSFGAAAEFLQKPFRSADLARKVNQLLGVGTPTVPGAAVG